MQGLQVVSLMSQKLLCAWRRDWSVRWNIWGSYYHEMRKIKSNLLRIGNQRIGKPVTSLGHKGANGFLRGPNFYKTMSDNFKLCPTRFSRGRKILQMAKPPYASLVTGLRIGCRARDQGPPSGFRQRSPFEKFATASTISYTQGEAPRCDRCTSDGAKRESAECFHSGRL